ncbi:hypothetical protein HanRHA438_Chr14g0667351 [Helianthus annuus]|nr:hypothetical protein HanRHA438_Chr14g0667351 [Helianthus annuus]
MKQILKKTTAFSILAVFIALCCTKKVRRSLIIFSYRMRSTLTLVKNLTIRSRVQSVILETLVNIEEQTVGLYARGYKTKKGL